MSILENIGWTEIIVTIVSLVATWALAQLSSYLSAKAESTKSQTEREDVKQYIDIAMDTVQQIVDMLNTTVVNDMKIASSDGKLTEDEIKEISLNARDEVLRILSVEAVQALKAVYGDINGLVDLWVTNAVEKAKGTTGITSDDALEISKASENSEEETGESSEEVVAENVPSEEPET